MRFNTTTFRLKVTTPYAIAAFKSRSIIHERRSSFVLPMTSQ